MTPQELQRLKDDEGCRLKAYPDPASPFAKALSLKPSLRPSGWESLSKLPWTCGYGCTGANISDETVWTQSQAEAELVDRVQTIELKLGRNLSWFQQLVLHEPVRSDVIINISFNIGVGTRGRCGFLNWIKTVEYLSVSDFAKAAAEIGSNKLRLSQVGNRVIRCAEAMRTGKW